jgi:hypothetical protein
MTGWCGTDASGALARAIGPVPVKCLACYYGQPWAGCSCERRCRSPHCKGLRP